MQIPTQVHKSQSPCYTSGVLAWQRGFLTFFGNGQAEKMSTIKTVIAMKLRSEKNHSLVEGQQKSVKLHFWLFIDHNYESGSVVSLFLNNNQSKIQFQNWSCNSLRCIAIGACLKKFLNPFCFACTLGLLPCLPLYKAK